MNEVILIHFLYVNWVPTHHPITQREFKNASEIFISKGEEKGISDFSPDFYLKEDLKHIKNCISFKLSVPQDCIAILHESGLILVEVKECKIGREDFKDFCDKEYYEPLKSRLHTHMFIHRLSGNFSFCESYEGKELDKVLQTLHRKYVDELKSQINAAKRIHSTYIIDLSSELEKYGKIGMKHILFKWGHILRLHTIMNKRIDFTKVYGFNINLAGVQGFINSFVDLTNPIINKPKKTGKDTEFVSAMGSKQDYLHEVGELYSVFGTQTLLIDIAFAAILFSIISLSLTSWLIFKSFFLWIVTTLTVYVLFMEGFKMIGDKVSQRYRRILKIERIELLAEQEEVEAKE